MLPGEAERLQGVAVDVVPAAAASASQEGAGGDSGAALPDLTVSLQQQAEAPLREGAAGILVCSIQVLGAADAKGGLSLFARPSPGAPVSLPQVMVEVPPSLHMLASVSHMAGLCGSDLQS